jgi:hypothetical protein
MIRDASVRGKLESAHPKLRPVMFLFDFSSMIYYKVAFESVV